MAEPRTYAAKLAKRVREALTAEHPDTRFKVQGVSAWRGNPDRVLVRWEDGPSKGAVTRTAEKVVRTSQLQMVRSGRPETLARVMQEGAALGERGWDLIRRFEGAELEEVPATPRAQLLARAVEAHLSWWPPKRNGEETSVVTANARAWRTAKLAVALKDESDEALEVLVTLARERSSELQWEQYVEMASSVTS